MTNPVLYSMKKIETHNDLQLLQEDVIRCANCNKGLIEVAKVKEDLSRTHVIIAECPFCGDTSFRYKVDGQIYMSAVNGTVINDAITEQKADGWFYSIVKVGKDG